MTDDDTPGRDHLLVTVRPNGRGAAAATTVVRLLGLLPADRVCTAELAQDAIRLRVELDGTDADRAAAHGAVRRVLADRALDGWALDGRAENGRAEEY
ncbi:hypothetical protein ACH437_22410 [Streptomyces xinghaiensis]|uniref:hypothetical protein n=1 Tax=Streptomyces xinghaiensis TaxID=1038928 RepID=UPI0037B8A8AB